MSHSLYWMQCGGCGGDSMSFLNLDSPDLDELFQGLDITLLHHPSLSISSAKDQAEQLRALCEAETTLDILVVEGAAVLGPSGTGLFDTKAGHPRKDILAALARRARYVIALGTCAAYGGFGSRTDTETTGLQFLRSQPGGLLGADFRSGAGLPVINLAGCPCHPDVLAGTLGALTAGMALELDHLNRPTIWYGMMVHQGCTRNEYHEYRVEDAVFGDKGCLFFYLGCHGPLTSGPCNKLLWNRRSSKPRAGVPCFGCTSAEFPQDEAFFHTANIEGIPLGLPKGVKRAHYMVYKVMAAAACPDRLKQRRNRI